MGQILQIGPRGFEHQVGVASATFTPLPDRAARVTGLRITKPSANDVWILSVSSKELARFQIDVVGNQQLLGNPSGSSPANRSLHTWAEEILDKPIVYPVPNGQVCSISSLAGATANIELEFEECDRGDIAKTECNHFEGRLFRLPIYGYLSSAISDNNEHYFDTQVSPTFVPKIFTNVQIQAAYEVVIHALWFEGGGRNTYSGAANHASTTDHLFATVNGQRLFTRVPYPVTALGATSGQGPNAAVNATLDGIPSVGSAAAAGSANSVYGADLERFPPFQIFRSDDEPIISPGIKLTPGSTPGFGIALNGDTTGGAAFAHNYCVALCDVTSLGA